MLVKERVIIEEPYDVQPKQTVPTPPVKKKKRVRKAKPNHLLRKVAALFVVIVFSSAVVTMMSSRVNNAGYALVKDKATLTKLQKENEQLHLDLARFKSPERIQEIAKKELKMSVPTTFCYPNGRRIAAPTPPKPMQKITSTENIIGMVEGFFKQFLS